MTGKFETNEKRLVTLLTSAPGSLAIQRGDDEMEIELAASSGLDAAQVGYAVDPEGNSLVGPRGWQEEWRVIGYDADLGDPVFVDLSDDQLPVYTAMHGAGTWDPDPLAPALDGFV